MPGKLIPELPKGGVKTEDNTRGFSVDPRNRQALARQTLDSLTPFLPKEFVEQMLDQNDVF